MRGSRRASIASYVFVAAAACSASHPAPLGSGATDDSGTTASDSSAAGSGNAVTGTIVGNGFGAVASAYWIGMPGAGSLPTQVYLSGAPLDCSTIGAPLWDKGIGARPLLELGVRGTTPNSYAIAVDAEASYLPSGTSAFNPSADGGVVTIRELHASTNIVGTFHITFGGDTLSGTFDAPYCAGGVEP